MSAPASVLDWAVPMMTDKFVGTNSTRMAVSVSASIAAIGAVKLFAPGKDAAADVIAASKRSASDSDPKSPKTPKAKKEDRQGKVAVNRAFFRHFSKLLKIAFPDIKSPAGGHLALLTMFLLLRTGLSLKTSQITGLVAKRMVETKFQPLAMAILSLALWAIPASFVNSSMKYLTSLLQISFRRNLTRHFHRRYLSQQQFFKCVGLGGVNGVEQRITQDVQKFSDGAAELYSTLFKPIIDIILFSRKVADYGGWKGPAMIIAYYSVITFLIRALAPNFGLLTSIQQQKEGRLRSEHTKLIEYAEEVSLSQGEPPILKTLNRLFAKSTSHYLYSAYMKAKNGVLDGILVKYGAVMVGYGVCAVSVFSAEANKMDSSELTGLYIHTSQLLVNLARAIGQLIMTYKTVASLAGYTDRVYQLEEGLNEVEKKVKIQEREKQQLADGTIVSSEGGAVVAGTKGIAFKGVPIISPDGTVLIKALSFYVEPGMNLLIVGPNGCGKSSTFRQLGELWPVHGGTIEKPSFQHLYYVPQRPYMSSGTLRDQVIYPTDAKDLKVGEDSLYECLEMASLEGLLQQPNVSWSARLNWAGEALSQGQKQKLAMARLFFHRPRFAILDECTSAIDLDIEQSLYTACRKLGISLITIAHRRSLWKYHDWVLRFDGNGGYMFSPLELQNDEMILTKVMSASDESKVGQRVVISLHHSKDEVDAEAAEPEHLEPSPSAFQTPPPQPKPETTASVPKEDVAEAEKEPEAEEPSAFENLAMPRVLTSKERTSQQQHAPSAFQTPPPQPKPETTASVPKEEVAEAEKEPEAEEPSAFDNLAEPRVLTSKERTSEQQQEKEDGGEDVPKPSGSIERSSSPSTPTRRHRRKKK